MRRNELINLRWSDVDFKETLIHVRNAEDFTTKNKEERVVPMSKSLVNKMRLIKRKDLRGGEYVFHQADGIRWSGSYVTHRFVKAVRASGLNKRVRFHDLRHSYCSMLVKNNVSLYLVGKIAGHKDYQTTVRYSHLNNGDLKQAVKDLK